MPQKLIKDRKLPLVKGQERIWILMARKLAGEASEEELKELQQWQQQHPDEIYSLQILFDFWMAKQPENREIAEQAFDEHLLRLQQLPPPAAQSAAAAAQPTISSPAAQPSAPAPAAPWGNIMPNRRRRQHNDMLKNYFKVSWRSFSRNKIFSAINISGL